MSKAHAAHVAPHDRVRIAAVATVSPDTVRRYIDGTHRTHETTRRRIEAAALSLGIVLPPGEERTP